MKVLTGVRAVDRAAWDALVGDGTPFCEWDLLAALEEAGCVGGDTGWHPAPVTVWDGDRLVGAAPAYVKEHSFGEYVYDWRIAHWVHQQGRRWYPKLVVAVPYNPVQGARLLVAPDAPREAVVARLVEGLLAAGADLPGVHVLFPDERDAADCVARGASLRLQAQYHWHNRGWRTFEGWLAALPSKRRTMIRRERRAVEGVRVEVVEAPPAGLAGDLWGFYRDTYVRHTGETGYLNAAFFEILCARWAHRIHVVLARDGGRPIAGTFNVRKGDRLYGRWWGASRDVPFLHFEVAIYAAVEWCIREGVAAFEPGHGGEHKRARGFEPVLTRSTHWQRDADIHVALRAFYEREAHVVRASLGEP